MTPGKKLTDEKLAAARRLLAAGIEIGIVAQRLGLARSTVSDIKNGHRHSERVA